MAEAHDWHGAPSAALASVGGSGAVTQMQAASIETRARITRVLVIPATIAKRGGVARRPSPTSPLHTLVSKDIWRP